MKASDFPLGKDAMATSFLTAPVPLNGTRRAALFLHALPHSDRDWVIEQLSDADRAAVEPLLLELGSLGIPADRGMLDEAIAGMHEPLENPLLTDVTSVPGQQGNGGSIGAQLELLATADPLLIASALRHEPSGLTARLLMLRQWPWREVVLRELGPIKRRNIEDRLVGFNRQTTDAFTEPPGSSTSLLNEHLLEHLLSRLRRLQAVRRQEQSTTSCRSWLSHFLRRPVATSK